MPFQPKQSGNPAGRPVRNRALTSLIARELSKTESAKTDKGDRRVSRKRLMAAMLTRAAATGVLEYPDGRKIFLEPTEYINLVFRLLTQVDGPAPAALDVNHSGGLIVEWEPHKPKQLSG